MRLRPLLVALAAVVLCAAAVFVLFQRQLSGAWFAFGIHPQVLELLESSREDQKQLARLDPEHREAYHQRFATVQTLVGRLRILEHNRGEIVSRYELLLLGLMATTLVLTGGFYALRQSRYENRLERLRGFLQQLCAGRLDLRTGERGRDAIGRVASMIEETSRLMARDRRRLEALKNLSAWQEAARRQAHEMRTPLTAARLELERLRQLAAEEAKPELVTAGLASLEQELRRLADFTRGFTSFARLPEPRRAPVELGAFLAELCQGFTGAWPRLRLQLAAGTGSAPCGVSADAEMLRQVLVNLCDNAALALGDRQGSVTFRLRPPDEEHPVTVHLEVTDDGPGVDAAVRDRLFEPYATTRAVGQGMGLGLAIAKKILLDHGGDLELAATSEAGTTFRLVLPVAAPETSS